MNNITPIEFLASAVRILPTKEVYTVHNYPYGYTFKTDKHYSIEFKKGKGFRAVEQTVNPKTGKLNKPKKGIYHPVALLYLNDDGHVKLHVEDFYDDNGKDRGYLFMYNNFDKFTTEQIKNIALYNIMLIKADILAKCSYCGSDFDSMKPFYDPNIKILVEIAKTGENLWATLSFDWKSIKALEIPNYQPFKVTSTSIT